MQGPIENALMLTAAGNAFLTGRDISGFWPDAPTFKFLKLFEFRRQPPSGNDADEYPLVAADPMAWFASLKPWCRGLRLHHAVRQRGPNQKIDTPDRMLVGFVGGGPRWLVEAVGQKQSQLWEGFHRIGDQSDPEHKIWLCTNILEDEIAVGDIEAVQLAPAVEELASVLPEIETFAREQDPENGFADCFARARNALDGKPTDDPAWMNGSPRFTRLDAGQLAVFRAIQHAWVFGGMGSWNDIGGAGERYETLSEQLFKALNDTVCGLANSTYRS